MSAHVLTQSLHQLCVVNNYDRVCDARVLTYHLHTAASSRLQVATIETYMEHIIGVAYIML